MCQFDQPIQTLETSAHHDPMAEDSSGLLFDEMITFICKANPSRPATCSQRLHDLLAAVCRLGCESAR
jgi:hypothetical protein